MSSSSLRKRLTVVASIQGVETAEKTLIRRGFDSKTAFAKAQLLARTAVTKFFNRQPIQIDTFKRICEGLKLDWRETLDSESNVEIEQPEKTGQPEAVEMSAATTSQTVGTMLAVARKITVRDAQGEVKVEIVLEGDIESADDHFKNTLEVVLRCYGGTTIQITDIKAGSIRITIQGSQQDIERLREKIAAGKLTQINNCRIADFKILSDESPETPESPSSPTKWEIGQAITTQTQSFRQLRDTDLSDADLSNADLSFADLRNADLSNADLGNTKLSGANLSGANLSDANLSNANLSDANLSDTNLSGANLRRANLNNANLSGANLNNANLRRANLSDANLSNANLSGANLNIAFLGSAIIDKTTQLDRKWRLVHSIVTEEASGQILINADLSFADLSCADLNNTNLSNADLSNTRLDTAFLNSADLSDADLSDADLSNAFLKSAILKGADLSNANLSDTNLSNADLSNADLINANLNNANLSGANLNTAYLSNVDLINANLSRANLRCAFLEGANLSNADLNNADLSEAHLGRAVVQNARFGEGQGLSEEEKWDLARRGAIFADASGDRESAYSPVR